MRIVAILCAVVGGCGPAPAASVVVIEIPAIPVPVVAGAGGPAVNPAQLRRFREIADAPHAVVDTPAQVELGRALWFDKRLSQDGTRSCESCHSLASYGVDGLRFSIGHAGRLSRRNTPTVFNAASDRTQFWDGRVATLEAQARAVLLHPDEMAMTERELVAGVAADPALVRMFDAALGERPSVDGITKAIAAFERTLVTRGRWDRYLAGDQSALTRDEVAGLRLFLNIGCVGCHTGPEVGASMDEVIGIFEPWPNQTDLGRFEITGDPQDRMVFRVPTLRNVARTGPYFHDGSIARLPDAVRVAGRVQLGVALTDAEVASLVTFLEALTGDLPESIAGPAAVAPAVSR